MKRELRNATVVITGASSGIGRAAARAFAEQGARLVVAARREAALQDVVIECQRVGAHALAVPTDVTDAGAVAELARVASESSGGVIDVWINNAGVGAMGSFEQVPIKTHEQVIRVNLLGYMHGAHAVLPFFKRQQSGLLINTISLGGWVPMPYSVAYSASKFGARSSGPGQISTFAMSFPRSSTHRVFSTAPTTPAVRSGLRLRSTRRSASPRPWWRSHGVRSVPCRWA
jgi:short-subunit dehydrogenase